MKTVRLECTGLASRFRINIRRCRYALGRPMIMCLAVAICGAASITFASTSEVGTYNWINTTAKTPGWGTDANWENGDWPLIKDTPAMTNSTFVFNGDLAIRQEIKDLEASYDVPAWLGTVLGSASHVLNCVNSFSHRYTTIRDASSFEGSLGVAAGIGGTWLLLSDNAWTTTVANARMISNPAFLVRTAGAKAVIERAWGRGRYLVNFANKTTHGTGAAEIEVIDSQGGPGADPHVVDGTFTVNGRSYEAPALAGDPWMHLDASSSASLTLTLQDGTNYVTSWADVRANGLAAIQDGAAQCPRLETDAVSGLPIIDFGGFSPLTESVKAYGPAGTLIFNAGERSDIREVFVVFRDAPTKKPVPSNTGIVCLQNFLCRAVGEGQYFTRRFSKRVNQTYYYGGLFDISVTTSGTKLTQPLASADVRLNGVRIEPEDVDDYSRHLNVLSVGLAHPVAADRFASTVDGHTGGIAFGEVLIYTNALTSAERRRVNAYLRAKWQPAEVAADLDFGRVTLNSGAQLKVNSGSVLVDEVNLNDTTFVKQGAGGLRVKKLTGQTLPKVNVTGGRLDFADTCVTASFTAPDEPPVAPETWFDANCGVSVFTTNVFDTEMEYVSQWVDRRDGTNLYGHTVVARRINTAGNYVNVGDSCFPTIRKAYAAANGRDMMDFGPQRTNLTLNKTNFWVWAEPKDASAMYIRIEDAAPWYYNHEGYLVISPNTNRVITVGTVDFMPGDKGRLLGYDAYGHVQGAVWTVNGERVDPLSFVLEPGQVYVIGYSLPVFGPAYGAGGSGVQNFAFLPPGYGSGTWGGIAIGEALTYPHKLTPLERRATEAYLLKKWLNREHPDAVRAQEGRALASIDYAEGATPELDVEGSLRVGVINGTGISFVKSGSGSLDVGTLPHDVASIRVEGGSLSTGIDGMSDAFLHVDASDASSFEFRTEPGMEDQIVKWKDTRGNGMYAALPSEDRGLTNAVYRTATYPGLVEGLPCVDFLDSVEGAKPAGTTLYVATVTNTSSGMCWYNAAGSQVTCPNLRECYIVFCDHEGESTGSFIGAKNSTFGARAPNYTTIFPWYSQILTWIDQNTVTTNKYNFSENPGFHVLTIVTTNAADMVEGAYFCIDRNGLRYGGCRIAEAVIFDKLLDDGRRQGIHNYLLKKWRAIGEGAVMTADLESVSVADGASLALESESRIRTAVLPGGDVTVSAPMEVTATAQSPWNYKVAFSATDSWNRLTVNGDLSLPDYAAVTLTVPASLKLPTGLYPFITATQLTADISRWTLDNSAAPGLVTYKLVKTGNAIAIHVSPKGVVFSIR